MTRGLIQLTKAQLARLLGVNPSSDTRKVLQVGTNDGVPGWASVAAMLGTLTNSAGDMFYRPFANPADVAALAVGNNGYILNVASGVPAWAYPGKTGLRSKTISGTTDVFRIAFPDGGSNVGGVLLYHMLMNLTTASPTRQSRGQLGIVTFGAGQDATPVPEGATASGVATPAVLANYSTDANTITMTFTVSIDAPNNLVTFRAAAALSGGASNQNILRFFFVGLDSETLTFL